LLGFTNERPLDVEAERLASDEVIPAIRSMMKNSAYRKYLVMKIPLAIAGLVPVNLLFYYIKFVQQEENSIFWTSVLAVITVFSSVVSVPFIVMASHKFGKRQALMAICTLNAVAFFVGAFMPAQRIFTCIFALFIGIGAVGTQLLPDAILGDIIDYDTLHTLRHSEGTYTVIETNVQQYVEIFAGTLPLLVFSWVGYENNAGCDCGCGIKCEDDYLRWNCPGDIGYACSTDFSSDLIYGNTGRDPSMSWDAPCTNQSDTVQWAVIAMGIMLPAVCYVWAIIPVWQIPINANTHAEILEATKDRYAGKEGVIDPISGHVFKKPQTSQESAVNLRLLKGYFSRSEQTLVPELQSKPVDGAQKQANLSKISRRLWFWLIFWVLAILGAVAVVVNFQTEATVTFCSLFLGICFVALPW
jgi:Na+/melibiose symporter-like transporter